jgi:DNA-binding MarR family transcriptional regulator
VYAAVVPGKVRWLSAAEQHAWRAYLDGTLRLLAHLEDVLKSTADLTMDDYEILVYLSESDMRRLRMSEVADRVLSSRSKLTYRVDRLVERGLIRRVPCDTDGRSTWAELTDAGYDLLVRVAPVHVASVRTALVDLLTEDEFAALGHAMAKVDDALRPAGTATQ